MSNWTDELNHAADVLLEIRSNQLHIHLSDAVPTQLINDLLVINKKAGYRTTSETQGTYIIHADFAYAFNFDMRILQRVVAKLCMSHDCQVLMSA